MFLCYCQHKCYLFFSRRPVELPVDSTLKIYKVKKSKKSLHYRYVIYNKNCVDVYTSSEYIFQFFYRNSEANAFEFLEKNAASTLHVY